MDNGTVTSIFSQLVTASSQNLTANLLTKSRRLPFIDISYLIFAGICTVLGFIGNATVLSVIIFNFNRSKKSIATHYIASLALADLLICCIYSPSTIMKSISRNYWITGAFTCFIAEYTRYVAMFASMLTLTAISYDRYQAICKPLQSTRTIIVTRVKLLIIWLTSAIFCSPEIFLRRYYRERRYPLYNNSYICEKRTDLGLVFKQAHTLLDAVIFFYGPCAIVIVCYGRIILKLFSTDKVIHSKRADYIKKRQQKRQIACLMIFITFFFIATWGLYWSYVCYYRINRPAPTAKVYSLMVWVGWLPMLSAAINPILYAFYGQHFRSQFRSRRKRRTSTTMLSKSRSSGGFRSFILMRNHSAK